MPTSNMRALPLFTVCDQVRLVLVATLAQLELAKPASYGVTVVTRTAPAAEPSLLELSESYVPEVLLTVLVNNPREGAVSVTVKLELEPPGRLKAGQVTAPLVGMPPP